MIINVLSWMLFENWHFNELTSFNCNKMLFGKSGFIIISISVTMGTIEHCEYVLVIVSAVTQAGVTIKCQKYLRTDSMFAPSQRETALLRNAVSHWLGTNLESVLYSMCQLPWTFIKWQVPVAGDALSKIGLGWEPTEAGGGPPATWPHAQCINRGHAGPMLTCQGQVTG